MENTDEMPNIVYQTPNHFFQQIKKEPNHPIWVPASILFPYSGLDFPVFLSHPHLALALTSKNSSPAGTTSTRPEAEANLWLCFGCFVHELIFVFRLVNFILNFTVVLIQHMLL